MLGKDKRNHDTPSYHRANFIKCSSSHDVSDQDQFEENEDAKVPWLCPQLMIHLPSSCCSLFDLYFGNSEFSQSILIYILLLPLNIYGI